MYYSIYHHGGKSTVTGSRHKIRFHLGSQPGNNQHITDPAILVDCGLLQGDDAERPAGSAGPSTFAEPKITFPISHIRALIITHVHIDPVGRLPYLLDAGFKGPILCSQAIAQLLSLARKPVNQPFLSYAI